MLRRASRAAGVLASGLVLGFEMTAGAEAAQPVRVEYRAPPACPDGASPVSRLCAAGDVRGARPPEPIAPFGGTLRNEGDKVVGRIPSTSDRSEPTSREVSGTDCS